MCLAPQTFVPARSRPGRIRCVNQVKGERRGSARCWIGLFGLTFAREAASDSGMNVTVIERRDSYRGNAYSSIDEATGVEVHRYGNHLFHTSNERVWSYVNQVSQRSTTTIASTPTTGASCVYPLPINLGTINQSSVPPTSPTEARALIEQQAARRNPGNLEEKAIT